MKRVLIFLLIVVTFVLGTYMLINTTPEAHSLDFTREDANRIYEAREASPEGLAPAFKTYEMYIQLANEEKNPLIKAENFISQTCVLYFIGDNSLKTAEKIKYHLLGKEAATNAISILERSPGVALEEQYSEPLARAYFWFAVHLVKWGEANGIVSSLIQLSTVDKYLNYIINMGEEQVYDYAVFRLLGRIAYMLPFPLRNLKKSLDYLEKANANSLCDERDISRNSTNVLFYADTLLALGGHENKEKAIWLLKRLIKKGESLETLKMYNPEIVPEAKKDINIAKNTLRENQ
ncbi:MAG: hypothetical protein HQK49_05820 [Oligoflexia bacterium]|nr:hypothetical protein [Oligoflexia bacterium]